jgi:aminopeptidase N
LIISEDLPDYVWDEFDKTLPMSTYILAFIVSEFEGLDSPELELQDHTQFRTWTRPSAGKQTEYIIIKTDVYGRMIKYQDYT